MSLIAKLNTNNDGIGIMHLFNGSDRAEKSKESLVSKVTSGFKSVLRYVGILGLNLAYLIPQWDYEQIEINRFLRESRVMDTEYVIKGLQHIDEDDMETYQNYAHEEYDNLIQYFMQSISYLKFEKFFNENLSLVYQAEHPEADPNSLIPVSFCLEFRERARQYYIENFEEKDIEMFRRFTTHSAEVPVINSDKGIEYPETVFMYFPGIIKEDQDYRRSPTPPKTVQAKYPGVKHPDHILEDPDGMYIFSMPTVIDSTPELWVKMWNQERLQSELYEFLDRSSFHPEIEPHVNGAVAGKSLHMSYDRNVAEPSDNNNGEKHGKNKTVEYKAEMYAMQLVEFLKDWIEEDYTNIIFADRGARPFGLVAEYLIEKISEIQPDLELPDIGYFKITSERKIVDSLKSLGIEGSDFDLSKKAMKLLGDAFDERFGNSKQGRYCIIDDWTKRNKSNLMNTKTTTLEMLESREYNADFRTIVTGSGDEKGNIDPKQFDSELNSFCLPPNWGEIVESYNRPLEIGVEYVIDRIKEGMPFQDDKEGITSEHSHTLFDQVDIRVGPNGIDVTNMISDVEDQKEICEMIYDYLTTNYKILEPFATVNRDIDDFNRRRIINLYKSARSEEEIRDALSQRFNEEELDNIMDSYRFFVSDNAQISQRINSEVSNYVSGKNNIDELNINLGQLIIDQYQTRLKRGVDQFLSKNDIQDLIDRIKPEQEERNYSGQDEISELRMVS